MAKCSIRLRLELVKDEKEFNMSLMHSNCSARLCQSHTHGKVQEQNKHWSVKDGKFYCRAS